MKIRTSSYPFGVVAETKKSKAGKDYLSIGVWQKSKDKDGNKKEVFFNMIDERDLLVIARVCEDAFTKISLAKSAELFGNREEQPADEEEQKAYTPEEIPW